MVASDIKMGTKIIRSASDYHDYEGPILMSALRTKIKDRMSTKLVS